MNITVLVLKYVQNCKSQLSLSSVMLLRKLWSLQSLHIVELLCMLTQDRSTTL